jgi:hypothetical protein
MPLFRGSLFKRGPRVLPLPVPRLDGSTWPDRDAVGRSSFAAATYYEMALQEAHTAPAHDVTDLVVEAVLPMLWTGAAIEDESHMQQVCSMAAQLGAGIGLVEARSVHGGEGTHSDVAGALWMAADGLPAMAEHQQDVARYVLQCGYHLTRTGPEGLAAVLGALAEENHPAYRPNH